MKKIILIVAAVAVLGGGAAYILTKPDKTSNNAQQASTANADAFNPLNSLNYPFIATTKIDGGTSATDTTIEYDGKGNWHSIARLGDNTAEAIYTSDAYYTLIGGVWYKSAAFQAFTKDAYELTPAELTEFQSVLKNKGKADCPAGSCQVWEAENYKGNDKLAFYVDTATNKINQLISVSNGKTITITYTYKDVNFSVPTNAQELPNIQQLQQ